MGLGFPAGSDCRRHSGGGHGVSGAQAGFPGFSSGFSFSRSSSSSPRKRDTTNPNPRRRRRFFHGKERAGKIRAIWFCIDINWLYSLRWALADPYFKGLSKIEREPADQPISKLVFDFDRRRVTKEDVRELIYREVLEYHPQLLKDYMNGHEGTNNIYPSKQRYWSIQKAACAFGGKLRSKWSSYSIRKDAHFSAKFRAERCSAYCR